MTENLHQINNSLQPPIYGCVIAGGQSLRMGGTKKPFIRWSEQTLIEIALCHIDDFNVDTCAISSSNSLLPDFERFLEHITLKATNLPTCKDVQDSLKLRPAGTYKNLTNIDIITDAPLFTAKGPLAGLYAALLWAYTQNPQALVYTCPVDTPNLTSIIPRRLLSRFHKHTANNKTPDCIIAAQNSKWHPIIGLWKAELHSTLHHFLVNATKTSFHSWLQETKHLVIDFNDINDSTFLNVNTPSDLF